MRILLKMYFVVFLFLAACTTGTPQGSSSGGNFGFKPVSWNGTAPKFADGAYVFTPEPGACGARTYGDGRGESDCNGGRVRSQIQAVGAVPVGREVEYAFDFWIPPNFVYDGDRNYPAYSRLLIAEWKRAEGIKNHLYEMLLESVRGVTFERKVCVSPAGFGQWNSFRLQIKWSAGNDGYMRAYCNERLILARENVQTVLPPDCGAGYKLQCDPAQQVPNAPILWSIGPNFSGYGRDYALLGKPSPFAPFPPGGIEVRVRSPKIRRISP